MVGAREIEKLREEFARDDAALQAALTGGPDVFLAWLLGFLRRAVGVELAFVGELWGEDRDRVRTISVVSSRGVQPNFEYDLQGTPCARVAQQGTCVHSRGVTAEFPEDQLLVDMRIESYAGMPLIEVGDQALGLAVLLGVEPLSEQASELAMGLLELFRPRLEAVLSKRRVLRELQLVVEGTTHATSEGALNHLAAVLAQAMHVNCAFISELVEPDGGRLRTLAMTIDGKPVDEIEYDMAGTACEAVYAEGHAFYGQAVCDEFPGDSFLRGLHAESYAGILFRDPDGVPLGHLALVHDRELTENPTEQSLFQIFAARARAEVQRRRAERARLAAERRLLEGQKVESLGLMASGIAHDFNNLLVAILGNADLAHAQVEPGSEAHDLLGEIVAAAQRAGDLSRQLLLFSGQRTHDMRPVDLNAIVHDIAGLLRISISKRCRVHYALAERLPAVQADPVQLHQIVMNLITNASEAVGDAEGVISIDSGTRYCTRMALDSWVLGADVDEGEYVYLEVSDTGSGLNAETQRRIFDPFFSTKGQSRGLGLAALLGIVRGHGGAIQVESSEGAGTAFTVYLPAATAEAEPLAPDVADDGAACATGRVLVVDDEPSVRRVASAMLERAGYETEQAADGVEAIRCFEERGDAFACVVLDVSMPRKSGEQTLLALKRLRPEIPVVLSSGYAAEQLLDRIDPAAVAAVVDKPYTTATLLRAVANAIAGPNRVNRPHEGQ